MKYVITGPTGSIGVNTIIKLLANSSHEVWAVCNPASDRNSLLPKNDRMHIVLCDMYHLPDVSAILPEEFDVFIHLAWAGTVGSARNDMKLQLENINCCINAVEIAKKHHCHTFVGAGSQAEYGRKNIPVTEDMICNPENGYGAAKLSAHHISKIMCRESGIRHLWLRFFSVYGPYENFTSLTSSTIIKYLKKEIPDFTEGVQLWDYCFAGDAADAALHLINNKSCSGIYNISSGTTRPLKDYIKVMADLCKADNIGNLGVIPYSPVSVMYLCGDISKLKKDAGCLMSTPFEEGIKTMIDWIKSVKGL